MENLVVIRRYGYFWHALSSMRHLSYKHAPVRLMSSLIFLGLVFSGFFDWVIWHEVPTELALAGIALVIVGASSLTRPNRG